MTTTTIRPPTTTPAPARVPMTFARRTSLTAGVLYLLTFLSSIPALILITPVLDHPGDFLLGSGGDGRLLWGCLLDLVNAGTAIGTAVVLFPIVRRQSVSLALGFVVSRLLEAAVVIIGVVCLLALVTLRQDHTSGADSASLVTAGQSLVAVRGWTFLLGPGLMPAINALLLGTLMYRSRLVPRLIPILGLVGAPVLISLDLLIFFGHVDQVSSASFFFTLPVALWELSLGLWMTFKGFRASPITASDDRTL